MNVFLWIFAAYLILWVVGMVAICLSPNMAEIEERAK